MEKLKSILAKLATASSLSSAEALFAFKAILSGEATPAQIGALLMALRVRGETVDELTSAVKILRESMIKVHAPESVDIVGTGGDNRGTYNISTLASLITASCGVKVAKHGNRAASSRSGASDVLQALGVAILSDPKKIETCIAETGIGFMMAPNHHTAMRHVAAARSELSTRTIFNLLGPMINPAGVTKLVIGVYSAEWLKPMAKVLSSLGSHWVWLVHGEDGLDEITVTGKTLVVEQHHNMIREFTIHPEDHGLQISPLENLIGGDATENAKALREVLAGKKCAYRDAGVFNAAAALIVGGKANNLTQAVAIATEAIDSGLAETTLKNLINISNRIA